jgi:hypothetical protein
VKKYWIAGAVAVVAALMLAGCAPMDLNGAEAKPTETAVTYDSAAALDQAVEAQKTSSNADDHKLATLDHYYGVKTLPQDAKLSGIKVLSFAVRTQYTFGQTSETNYDNRMELVWYRDTTGTDFISKISADTTLTKINSGDILYYKTVAKAKAGDNDDSTVDYCQIVYWSQDNMPFMAAVPMGFTEDDIRKYCLATQVPVN